MLGPVVAASMEMHIVDSWINADPGYYGMDNEDTGQDRDLMLALKAGAVMCGQT